MWIHLSRCWTKHLFSETGTFRFIPHFISSVLYTESVADDRLSVLSFTSLFKAGEVIISIFHF